MKVYLIDMASYFGSFGTEEGLKKVNDFIVKYGIIPYSSVSNAGSAFLEIAKNAGLKIENFSNISERNLGNFEFNSSNVEELDPKITKELTKKFDSKKIKDLNGIEKFELKFYKVPWDFKRQKLTTGQINSNFKAGLAVFAVIDSKENLFFERGGYTIESKLGLKERMTTGNGGNKENTQKKAKSESHKIKIEVDLDNLSFETINKLSNNLKWRLIEYKRTIRQNVENVEKVENIENVERIFIVNKKGKVEMQEKKMTKKEALEGATPEELLAMLAKKGFNINQKIS